MHCASHSSKEKTELWRDVVTFSKDAGPWTRAPILWTVSPLTFSQGQVPKSTSFRLPQRWLSLRAFTKTICSSAMNSVFSPCRLALGTKRDIDSTIQLVFEIRSIKWNHSLRSIQMISRGTQFRFKKAHCHFSVRRNLWR